MDDTPHNTAEACPLMSLASTFLSRRTAQVFLGGKAPLATAPKILRLGKAGVKREYVANVFPVLAPPKQPATVRKEFQEQVPMCSPNSTEAACPANESCNNLLVQKSCAGFPEQKNPESDGA